jgi:hypothetical protein
MERYVINIFMPLTFSIAKLGDPRAPLKKTALQK